MSEAPVTVAARTLDHATLPPVPASPVYPYHLLWHPIEKAFWLFVPGSSELWRVEADGTGSRLASGAIGIPENFPSAYLHGQAFYFDTARNAPVWLFSTYADGFGEGLVLHAWNGSAFTPIAQQNGIVVASSDSFVFDPARGVLVHFAGLRDMRSEISAEREKRGGLTVRELGKDGVWRDVGKPLANAGMYETYAGWDERRKLAVFIDNETGETHGWNGKAWSALGKLPDAAWKPNTMTQAPRTKSLVFLQKQRSSTDHTALLWELGDAGWMKRDAGTLESWGGAARDPEHDVTFVLGPWLGPGTVQTTLARYDGEKLVLAGKPAPIFTGASKAGPAVFWGALQPTHGGFSHEARAPYSSAALSALVDGALAPLASSPPSLALAASAAGVLSVGFDGEVSRLAGGKFTRLAKAPSGFAERSSTTMGNDESGRLFLVGGQPIRGNKHLTDAWLFDGKAWSEIPAKGALPSAIEAHVAFDAARGVWILAGGVLENYSPNPKTYEHDGKKWSSFAADFGDGRSSLTCGITLFAYDGPSATAFVIGIPDYGSALTLYAYRGAGAWRAIATLVLPDGAGALAYDTTRRVLVAAGAGSLGEIDIASLLDGAKGSVVDTPAPEKTKKKTKATKKGAARIPGRTAYHMTIGKKGEDSFGGVPAGITKQRWPVCRDCKHPMPHVLVLHAHDERLPLREHAAIALFACNGAFSGGSCATWEADAGCNAAILLTASDLAAKPLRTPPGGEEAPAVMKAQKIAYSPHFEADPSADENAEDIEATSKVGGYPVWIQGAQTPVCAECNQEMRFVAQIQEVDEALNFGGGDGYLFCCPEEHAAKFLWQQ